MSSNTALCPQLLSPVLRQYPNAKRWLLAYSGGVDSHVLLTLSQQFLTAQPTSAILPQLCALHINHQLHSEAGDWAKHCAKQAEQLNVSFNQQVVDIVQHSAKSLEEAARQARYSVFEKYLQPGDVLLLGHHGDDQAETLMLRLLRGSGSLGLAAMPQQRSIASGYLYRPLLECSRLELEAYARQEGLNWIEDPSNQQQHFDRNFLRLKVLPALAERWPQYRRTFTRAARMNAQAHQLHRDLAQIDAQQLGLDMESAALSIASLTSLNAVRLSNLLRFWLQCRQLVMPSEAHMAQLTNAVIFAHVGASPELKWGGLIARRHAGELIIESVLPAMDSTVVYRWDLLNSLDMAGAGRLGVSSQQGEGLRQPNASSKVEIRFRQGGEVCRPAGRGGSRKLKKILQELSVPPWLRDRVPLIYCDDELIGVADFIISENWQAGPEEKGLTLSWQRP